MSLDILYQQSLFENYQAGQNASLSQVLAVERFFLFDYLLRMTGDMNRSLDTLENVTQKILATEKKWQSLSEFRFAVYNMSRQLNAGFWHVDVGLLENTALLAMHKDPQATQRDKKRAAAYLRLDHAIGASSPEHREVLILHLRSKFTLSEIAKIMDRTREEVETSYGECIQYLKGKVINLPNDPRTVISRLSPHPLPEADPTDITDLHELIGGLRKDQGYLLKTWLYIFLIIILLVILLFLATLYFKPELFFSLTIPLKKGLRFVLIYIYQ